MVNQQLEKSPLVTTDNSALGSYEVYGSVLLIYLCWRPDFHEANQNLFCNTIENNIADLDKYTHVIVYAWPDEFCNIESLLMIEQKIKDSFGTKPCIILYNNTSKNPETFSVILEDSDHITWIGIDYFAFRCYYLYRDHQLEWNPISDSVLWLVGNPGKCERLIPFYMLAQSGFAKKYLKYSFNPDYCAQEQTNSWYDRAKNTITSVSREHGALSDHLLKENQNLDYSQWSSKHTHKLDIDLGLNQYDGTVHDLGLYEDQCAEFIVESRYDTPWFRTEKTYRALALGFPLFVLGTHFIKRLQQDGYRTFDRYVDWDYEYPDYFPYFSETQNYITETHKIMNAIPEFIKVCKSPETQQRIREDIEHNRETLEQYVIKNISSAQEVLPHISDIFFQNVHTNKN